MNSVNGYTADHDSTNSYMESTLPITPGKYELK